MAGLPEAIGAAAGLSALFNAAVTWFDYVYIARNSGLQFESLLLKLDNSQLRLTRWGKAVGLSDDSSRLDEDQEKHARATFQLISNIFIKFKEVCHADRDEKGKTVTDEEEPFGPEWKSPMSKYLHDKMQSVVSNRRTKTPLIETAKFAIYKKNRLEDLVKEINEHIDNLYHVCPPEKEEQERLGKVEFDELIHVLRTLQTAADRDTLLSSAVTNILNQQVRLGF